MILTTMCYIQRNQQTLLLHRIKKKNDINGGKWIGVGGKFEAGESAEAVSYTHLDVYKRQRQDLIGFDKKSLIKPKGQKRPLKRGK